MSGRLPEYIGGPEGLTLRRETRDDEPSFGEAVADSVEHLRPRISWIANEPLSVTERQAQIDSWDQEWLAGGGVVRACSSRAPSTASAACTAGSSRWP